MLTNDDVKQLREEMGLRFVMHEDCAMHREATQNQLAENRSDFSVIKFQLRLILGVLGAIGTAVLSLVITTLWS